MNQKKSQDENLEHLRHSASHLMAAVVLELWPDAKLAIGPAIENGFYYDFEFKKPISPDDLPAIEKKMREIVKGWSGFERIAVTQKEAEKEFKNNPYKLELIKEAVEQGQELTIYQSGNFRDLCRGGHCKEPTRDLKYFKLLSVAGAYWKGSEKNKMLTRIYGTAFFAKQELDQHLKNLEEAKSRDHRKIGRELELFTISDKVGKGMPLWLPNGAIMLHEIEKLVFEKEREYGYQRVVTPHLAKEELYLISGHLPYYKDDMFPGMKTEDGTYYLKPMNCPHHHMVYVSKPRSWRDLPVRLAEYGTVYRNERSGTLAGLLRVRMISMNDAHIYCTEDQVEAEIKGVVDLILDYYKLFGLKDYYFRLSLGSEERSEKYINDPKNWERAEMILRKTLKKLNINFVEARDEAAFYGPKLDTQFTSVIGREETVSTIQLDFVTKDRFNLSFIDKSGKENPNVYVIHRAPLSAHERFIAFLIEHFAGNFPVWLSPIQVRVVPVSAKYNATCATIAKELNAESVRCDVDDSDETVGNKIRRSAHEKIPYTLVMGEKEEQSGKLAVRIRGEEKIVSMSKKAFIDALNKKIKNRELDITLSQTNSQS